MEKQDPISHESLSPGRIFNPEIIKKNILNNVLQRLLLKTVNNQTSNLNICRTFVTKSEFSENKSKEKRNVWVQTCNIS